MAARHQTVDDYIAALPEPSRIVMLEIRELIAAAVPDLQEAMRYDMPAADLGGRHYFHYAAWKKHVGLYPVYRGSSEFEERIAPYRDKKDTVRFPLNRQVPYDVIDLIVRVMASRAQEDQRL